MSIFSKINLNSLPANLHLKSLSKNDLPKPKTNLLKKAMGSDTLQKNEKILNENIYYKHLTAEELEKYASNKQITPKYTNPDYNDPPSPPPTCGAQIPLKNETNPIIKKYYPLIEITPKKYSEPIVEISLPSKRPQEIKFIYPIQPKIKIQG